MEKLTCAYCGKVKAEFSLFIGAKSKEPDWCMHEGTGKVSCPDCYSQAQYEAAQVSSHRYQEERRYIDD